MTRKALFGATYPDQGTGYGRVAHHLSNFLLADEWDVTYFGTGNHAYSRCDDRPIDPRLRMVDVMATDTDDFGVNVLVDTLRETKPSVVLLYNDVIVLCRWLNEIIGAFPKSQRPFRLFLYLDLVYPFEKVQYVRHVLQHADHVFFFTRGWEHHVMDQWIYRENLPSLPTTSVLPHGIDDRLLARPRLAPEAARAQLNLPTDGFFFLNMNRNSYRKALDLTTRAFLLLLQAHDFDDSLRLVFKCIADTSKIGGYDLPAMIRTECAWLGLSQAQTERVVTHHVFNVPSHALDEARVHALYCACEVGVNTCIGEGFGLTSLEHACLGCPQVVVDVGALKEIFVDAPVLPVRPVVALQIPTTLDDHVGVAEYADARSVMWRMRDVWRRYAQHYAPACRAHAEKLQRRHGWPAVRDALLRELRPS